MITTIGCCDSGLGGMQVVKALKEAYPNLNIVYIADQSNYIEKTYCLQNSMGPFDIYREVDYLPLYSIR